MYEPNKINEETLEALIGSIEKWRKIVYENGKNRGAEDCPLCSLYNKLHMEKNMICVGCPVYEKTHTVFCRNTPYESYDSIGEYKFLKSLLPSGIVD